MARKKAVAKPQKGKKAKKGKAGMKKGKNVCEFC